MFKSEYIVNVRTYIYICCICKHNAANHSTCGQQLLGLTLRVNPWLMKFNPGLPCYTDRVRSSCMGYIVSFNCHGTAISVLINLFQISKMLPLDIIRTIYWRLVVLHIRYACGCGYHYTQDEVICCSKLYAITYWWIP